jgi:hypothetical protein
VPVIAFVLLSLHSHAATMTVSDCLTACNNHYQLPLLAYNVELLEHIGRHKMNNYMPIVQRSGILFLTASQVG